MRDVSREYLQAEATRTLGAPYTSDGVLTPSGDVWKGFETPKQAWLSGTILVGLAFAAFKLGQESVRRQNTSLPPLGALVGTFVAFKALDAIWPLGKKD